MMTGLTPEPELVDAARVERATGRRRLPVITAMVLVGALIGLGAWVVYDRDTVSETAVTGEIQSVVDDYLATWNSVDAEAFLELVTTNYVLHMTGSSVSITQGAEEASEMLEGLEGREWKETPIGEPIMTGDGPWFVSLVEHFSAPDYGPEGADGVSTFTIVDDGGALKVSRHTYVGNN